MNYFNNSSGIMAFFVLLFIGVGCCGEGFITSQKQACITPDASKIAIADWNGVVTMLDAETGKIVKRKEREGVTGGDSGIVVCTKDNEVMAVYPEIAVSLTNDRRAERRGREKIIGSIGNDKLVGYSGGVMTTDSDGDYFPGRPLEIYLEELGEIPKEKKPLVLQLEMFEGTKKNAVYYWISPVRLLEDNKLLVIAGARPQGYGYGQNTETYVNPESWGFFTVDPEDGNISKHGSTKMSDSEIHLLYTPKAVSTLDGRFIALASGIYNEYYVAVFDTKADREIFRKAASENKEFGDLILSKDGKYLAVAVKHNSGGENDRVYYAVRIYDIETKEELSDFVVGDSTFYFVDLREERLIVHDHQMISKFNVTTGKAIWKKEYLEQ